jgi:hypothetical protein
MPNWCTNQLIVCGPIAWVDLFHEKVTVEAGFDILNSLYPCPEDLTGYPSRHGAIPDGDPDKERKEANLEKYGHADWYDWCVTNWGTKWGDCDTVYRDSFTNSNGDLKTSMYTFDSAWGPPEEGILHIAKSFKPLLFDLRYQEPGMAFCGYARIGNGEVIHEQTSDFITDAEMVYECIDWDYEYDMKRGLDEADVK